MSVVQILPDHVANQIAAGEVVERPASVVKELVENALDAGARQIQVDIQAGGRSLIRIADDGVGMSRDDALLAIERHGTSKIRKAEDLASILTMGFRGEALPSIASVSRFSLVTRERESDRPDGTEILIEGGKVAEARAAGSPPGTAIEVRNLFFNLPARRKFLRTQETERAHIHHYLNLVALAHPEVALTFRSEGRVVWQLPAIKFPDSADGHSDALRERLRELLGSELELRPVEGTAESGDSLRVWGFASPPGLSRASRQDQHLFVNRRPVENRGLNMALIEGYHTALPKGRFPICCLFIEMDPALVDVNIHPAKREVKFHNEMAVRRLVADAIREMLMGCHAASAGPPPEPGSSPAVETQAGPRPAVESDSPAIPEARPFPSAHRPQAPAAPLPGLDAKPGKPAQTPPGKPAPKPKLETESRESETEPPRNPAPPPTTEPAPTSSPPAPGPRGSALPAIPLKILGIVANNYVVLESDQGLVLMDQRAAHERVLYERTLARLSQGDAASQRLLLPETVELSSRDAAFVRQQLESLSRMGVGLNEFGEQTFLLDALPPFVKVADARQFVLELIDQLKSTGSGQRSPRLSERAIARSVCHQAVRTSEPLSRRELEQLLQDLRNCEMPYTCPNGHPTLIEMSLRELERKFGRTQ